MIKIRLEKFEGPMSLLLKLIEQEEMDITQVSLANVANQFVEYIRQKGAVNPEEMADFLVVAAKLLLIKSKALLPYLYPEEEVEIEELEYQLRMYKEFLAAAKEVQAMLGKKKFMFPREFNRKAVLSGLNIFSPPKKLTKGGMKEVMADIIGRIKPAEILEEDILEYKINIEDKIMNIQNMLLDRIKVSFNKVMETAENKTEIIVSFLAILELMRQREIVLEQEDLFGEITISKK